MGAGSFPSTVSWFNWRWFSLYTNPMRKGGLIGKKGEAIARIRQATGSAIKIESRHWMEGEVNRQNRWALKTSQHKSFQNASMNELKRWKTSASSYANQQSQPGLGWPWPRSLGLGLASLGLGLSSGPWALASGPWALASGPWALASGLALGLGLGLGGLKGLAALGACGAWLLRFPVSILFRFNRQFCSCSRGTPRWWLFGHRHYLWQCCHGRTTHQRALARAVPAQVGARRQDTPNLMGIWNVRFDGMPENLAQGAIFFRMPLICDL